jgi:hypothetical protein
VPDLCATCVMLTDQDALQIQTLEIVETNHNACAPVTYYSIRCRTCETRWNAIEVYDEDGKRASEWSWSRDPSPRPT